MRVVLDHVIESGLQRVESVGVHACLPVGEYVEAALALGVVVVGGVLDHAESAQACVCDWWW